MTSKARRSNVQTVEDPIEYTIAGGVNQMQMHRDIGLTFRELCAHIAAGFR